MSSQLNQAKLNKDLSSFLTYQNTIHIPIHEFMRTYFLSRSSIFTLAKNRYLSITQIKRRYFVGIPSPYTINDIYRILDNGC